MHAGGGRSRNKVPRFALHTLLGIVRRRIPHINNYNIIIFNYV